MINTDIEQDGDKTLWVPEHEDVILEWQKRYIKTSEGDRGGKQHRAITRPLDIYAAKGQITSTQHRAGKRLTILWVKAAKSPYVQARYKESEGARATMFFPIGMGHTEYREALYSITSIEARKVVHHVCCNDIAASNILTCTSKRSAERKGMLYLRAALDSLVKFFEYEK
jgi:hypothetical protein